MKETYQIANFDGENYDTKLPIELVEAFSKLKEKLVEVSNGRYQCTPFVFNPMTQGLSTSIIETNENKTIKLPFYLSIK